MPAPSTFAFRPSSLSGVTLTELLITVLIMSILAAIALPQYRKTMEVNYHQQAQDLLTTIYYGERAYRLANNKFVDPAGTWSAIFMDNPAVGAPPPITYAVTAANTTTFTATATRAAGSGMCAGDAMTLNENRSFGGSWLGCP